MIDHSEFYQKIKEFNEVWPLERVENMALAEYTNLNKSDSFCYWLEARTYNAGSIWGGSAFKFGIYEKNQKLTVFSDKGRLSDDDYAWSSKYGSTRDEAFNKVKSLIVSIIHYTKTQEFEKIEAIDLGDAIKWKIAFMYSDFKLLNIFKKEKLIELSNILNLNVPSKASFYSLQNQILNTKEPNQDFLNFYNIILQKLTPSQENKKYWLYSPGEGAYKWDEFFDEGIMALGWDELENLNEYANRDEIRNGIIEAYGGEGSKKNVVSANDDFLNKMSIGDVIIVKKGLYQLLGYGVVESDYYHDETRNDYLHCRKVNWKKKGNWAANHTLVLKTLTEVTNYKSPNNMELPYYEYLMKQMDMTLKSNQKYIDLLTYKKQIILQGPPGTGKTRVAKLIAKELLGNSELEKNEQFNLIQFHPSYTYEDFVRGIVAKPNPDGDGIIYDAENKTIGEFAKKALVNYKAATIDSERVELSLSDFTNHIIEVIGEQEKFQLSDKVYIYYVDDKRFKYKGNNWSAHPNGLNMNFSEIQKIIDLGLTTRQEINKSTSLNALTRQHATYYQRIIELFDIFKVNNKVSSNEKKILKKYVLVIDEINRANLSSVLGELIYALEYRGKEVESMYDVDGKELVLPTNLYIIGTMNTADRSVGHIDYAIRRRFAFVDILPKDLSDDETIQFDSTLFSSVKALFTTDEYKTRSQYLSNEFDPKDVALGHSYFIDKSAEGGTMQIRLEYEIKPILREYVKDGVLIGDTIIETIENLEVSI